MPQNYKTSINNLIIVWQGSNWSVISPDGSVIFRSFDKENASDFARGYKDYAGKNYAAYAGKILDIVEDTTSGLSLEEKRIMISDLNTAHNSPRGNSESPDSPLEALFQWVVVGLIQAFVWVLEAAFVVFLVVGMGIGGLVAAAGGVVAVLSGLSKWVLGGWPFQPQVFLNSVMITILAFITCVICYQIAKAKGGIID